MTEEAPFESTERALWFAFNYARHGSPKTPLMSMNVDKDRPPIGSNKGLVGVDAAGQAGLILKMVDQLNEEQRNFIIVKHGIDMRDYKSVSIRDFEEPPEIWKESIDYFSNSMVEFEGVPRRVRNLMIEKAIFGKKIDIEYISRNNSLSKATTYRQLSEVKKRFRKIEKIALINLDNSFLSSHLLVA